MFEELFQYYSFQECITTSIESERIFLLEASLKKIRNFFISFKPVKYLAHICKAKEKIARFSQVFLHGLQSRIKGLLQH